MRRFTLVIVGLLAACAGPKLPAPNSADVRYDGRDRAVQVMVSNLQPPTAAALVANDGTRYPASGMALVSGPHVLYNPPPSVGLGIGGFGFSGCCSGFGSGIGVGVPVGRPTPAEVSDQYVASALIPVPPDYCGQLEPLPRRSLCRRAADELRGSRPGRMIVGFVWAGPCPLGSSGTSWRAGLFRTPQRWS
jgi:hypothetical protein